MSVPQQLRDELRTVAPRLAGTLGASGAAAVLGLVSGTIAARGLGPDGRGDLAQLLLWPQLFATLGILGVELSAIYFSGDERRRPDVPATLLVVAAAQSMVLLPLYVIVIPVVFAGSDLMKEALMMAPLIPMYLFGAVAIDCLAGRLRFGAFNAVRILLPVTYCGGVVAVAATGALSSTSGALVFMLAHAAGDVLALLLVVRGSGLGSFNAQLARDALHFGVRAHFGRITPASLGVDIAVIALMLSSSRDVGLYVAAAAFLAAPNLVASSIGMVVYPHVSASHQSGRPQRFQATFLLQMACVTGMALCRRCRPVVRA
jgi:O-antigen/teichoic acid export membrane protein